MTNYREILRLKALGMNKQETEAGDLPEIAKARYTKASIIFCSQSDVPGWREKVGDPVMSDAICDRIVHESLSIIIDCKEPMRKR